MPAAAALVVFRNFRRDDSSGVMACSSLVRSALLLQRLRGAGIGTASAATLHLQCVADLLQGDGELVLPAVVGDAEGIIARKIASVVSAAGVKPLES